MFLSADPRHCLANYLECERPEDATDESVALFLSATSVASRRLDGRLAARSINTILERNGGLHDAEHTDPKRHISPRRPHDLRHIFAQWAAETDSIEQIPEVLPCGRSGDSPPLQRAGCW